MSQINNIKLEKDDIYSYDETIVTKRKVKISDLNDEKNRLQKRIIEIEDIKARILEL